MGRKPVLALAGALVTSLALAGCQSTSGSRPISTTPTTAANQSPKTTTPVQPTSGVASNQFPQNPASPGSSLQGQQQPMPGSLTGQASLNAAQPSPFNGQSPPAPAPVSNQSLSSMQQPAKFGPQPAMPPAGPLPANSSFSAPTNGPSLTPNSGTPIGMSGQGFGNPTPSVSASGPMPGSDPYAPTPSSFGSQQSSMTRISVPEVPMPPSVPTRMVGN
jgi:hypothetical protein